ncbi:MAG: hypothetical protein COV10_01945 [Candidatus Vogelbacteria bacterium CG10_big_fil_rev_8_21_14_0_10_51_16]|uniref:GtrA-like protein domain-containing protein n=1 Tax=Candidatus Vogelbacteria bacterium CG10_big_fil_rev_8_21_14_0_10_51_16 TaxID=1975045 RepID=A0A2H0REQ8_9BACT|nr:MAG: hypothetical protein COV10_01945 [Candidatus Vogelbacteria bacterium CG10_big_fil_rev_8_21_14_0_10_51_16]
MVMILRLYEWLRRFLATTYPRLFPYLDRHKRIIKYGIAGGTAGVTDLALLYFFTEVAGFHYLFSSTLAFVVAFAISFFLQKLWTFRDDSMERVHTQAIIYLMVALANLGMNTLLMYLLVSLSGLWYIFAQVVASLAIASYTFFINKLYIFRKRHREDSNDVQLSAQNSSATTPLTILLAAAQYPPAAGGPPLHAHTYFTRFPEHGFRVRKEVFADLLWLPFGVRQAVYLLRVLRSSLGVDAIYSFDASSSGWAAFITAFVLRKPLIYRVGGDRVWELVAERGDTRLSVRAWYASGAHRRRAMYWLTKFSLHRADVIIVTTELLVELYREWYGIPSARLRVVTNPLPEKIEEGFVEAKQSLVFSSRLVAYKNLDTVIRALAGLRREFPRLSLVLIGDGPERERLEELVAEGGNEQAVHFLGKTGEDVPLLETRACLATIAPAASEFCPNYVLRGIAYGKPFLISREHGLPFKVPEEYLIDPDNPQAIVAKIRALLSEEGYLRAKQWIANLDYKQTWEDVIRENVKIIRELVG